jgi:hypothetical protein
MLKTCKSHCLNAIRNVGAGLLAKAVYQYQIFWLTERLREQARSHIGPTVLLKPCFVL